MSLADWNKGYFFLSLRAGQRCLFDYLSSVFAASGEVNKLVAFRKASLNIISGTLPRYLPLAYLAITEPALVRYSMMTSSAWDKRYICEETAPYEFMELTIIYQAQLIKPKQIHLQAFGINTKVITEREFNETLWYITVNTDGKRGTRP